LGGWQSWLYALGSYPRPRGFESLPAHQILWYCKEMDVLDHLLDTGELHWTAEEMSLGDFVNNNEPELVGGPRFEDIEFPLTVYRAIRLLNGLTDLRKQHFGKYWTFDERVAEHWQFGMRPMWMFRTVVERHQTNWLDTVDHNQRFEHEKEIRLHNGVKLMVEAYKRRHETIWTPCGIEIRT
jgi:hypothetical protein